MKGARRFLGKDLPPDALCFTPMQDLVLFPSKSWHGAGRSQRVVKVSAKQMLGFVEAPGKPSFPAVGEGDVSQTGWEMRVEIMLSA